MMNTAAVADGLLLLSYMQLGACKVDTSDVNLSVRATTYVSYESSTTTPIFLVGINFP